MPHGQAEGEPEHDPGLLRAAVALAGELLEEVVTAGHADLPQGQAAEDRRDERAHVPLVELPRGPRKVLLKVEALQPVVDELLEAAVRG